MESKAVGTADSFPNGEGDDAVEAAVESQGTSCLDADLPEMLDLIDSAEQLCENPSDLAHVVKQISRRIRLTPEDRDLLSDFEGIAHVCAALSQPPHNWAGEAMIAFCRAMPEICRTSNVNRGSLRDAGFVSATIGMLRSAVANKDEAAAIAAAIAISAVCTANDCNKRVSAQLWGQVPPGAGNISSDTAQECPAADRESNGLLLLLEALLLFPDSTAMQTEGVSALRSLLTDDGGREVDCEPSAVENREAATSDSGFPFFGAVVEHAFSVLDASTNPQTKLHEQALLLLRELARRQDRVQPLAFGAKLLSRALSAATDAEDPRIARAGFGCLRNFAVAEEVRDEISFMCDGLPRCIVAIRRHLTSPPVCEQGFGFLSNMTMRKSAIVAKLMECEPSAIGLGAASLRQHRDRADVHRSVIQTLRNMASQEETAKKEIQERDVFDEVRTCVRAHEADAKWKAAVDISRQFLREWREDEGLEKLAKYNAFY